MSHSEGMNFMETALAYVEQQKEATVTDILLFRHYVTLPQTKGRRIKSKYHY
jgi:hypothetical protein